MKLIRKVAFQSFHMSGLSEKVYKIKIFFTIARESKKFNNFFPCWSWRKKSSTLS